MVRYVSQSRAEGREQLGCRSPFASVQARGRRSRGSRFRRPGDDGGSRRGPLRDISLDDKYVLEEGRILLTGLQALVRLPLDQHRADRRRGLHTGTLISGYQGSPLGGLDQELARNRELVEEHHVRHVPGLNEELGATSVWGSQLAAQLPGAKYDGVLGHVVRQGARPRPRGRLAPPRQLRRRLAHRRRRWRSWATTPAASPPRSRAPPSRCSPASSMPVFFPGNVQEVLDLGLHALACSRASGLWAGFKIVTNVADALGTADGRARPRRCP